MQLIYFIFFFIFALCLATFVLKLKAPEKIFLSAAIISAPWSGGIWANIVRLDIRLTYFFLIVAFILTFKKKLGLSKKNSITISIIIPQVCLILWAVIVSLTAAVNPNNSFAGVTFFAFNLLMCIVIIKTVEKPCDVSFILKSIFLGLFITSVIAILQYKIRFFHIGFIDRDFTEYMPYRTRATFHHANHFGMFQLFVLPILFREIVAMLKYKDKKLLKLYCALFFVVLFTFFTTGNRGSWIGFAFGMGAVIGLDFFRRSTKKTRKILMRIIIVFSVILAVGSIKYGPRVYNRFFGAKSADVYEQADHRKELNVSAYNIIDQFPVTGVGIRNYQFYSSKIFTHNVYLLVISEVGYVGLVFFIWTLLGLLFESRRARKAKSLYVSNMGSGYLSLILGFLLASYVGPDYWNSPQVSSMLWIITGLIVGLNKLNQKMTSQKSRKKMYKNNRINNSDMSRIKTVTA